MNRFSPYGTCRSTILSISPTRRQRSIYDSNIIDPFHLQAYGVSTVNWLTETSKSFPVLAMMAVSPDRPRIVPTREVGVNMAGLAITLTKSCPRKPQR